MIAKMASITSIPAGRAFDDLFNPVLDFKAAARNRSCDSKPRNGGLPGLTFALSG